MGDLDPKVIARFWAKIIKVPDACWLWTGAKRNGGYGCLFVCKGKTIAAHRLSFWLHNGYLPERPLEVRHTCDNPPCANPEHLVAGTHRENMHDMMNRGRARFDVNRPCGENNHNAKLTWDVVRQIREMGETRQFSQDQIADKFGLQQPQVSLILLNKAWKEK